MQFFNTVPAMHDDVSGDTETRGECRLDVAAFLRLFQLRNAQIMWFLGAGASRAAGIKTAGDMIWDFKQRLYRSEKKLPPSAITDISESAVQRKLQEYFDALGSFPPLGAAEEYSAYFEATYPSPRDRRTYLDELIARGKPSFGHLALALLMREQLCQVVWGTNFDRTVEDAAAIVLGGTGGLVVADLAQPEKLRQAWVAGRWPVYGKLHGDYHSDNLKNTDAELQKQDAEMRRTLVDACRQKGLAVIGYSGRDASVMEALTAALDGGMGFPAGLFWFKRSQDHVYPAVTNLIRAAREHKIEAYFVATESFDELFLDLLRFMPQTYEKIQLLAGAARPRLATATITVAKADVPAIRTNGLPVTSYPALCRLVECDIGGFTEVEAAIEKAQVDIDARRCNEGVVAFGRDADIRRAFDPHGISAFKPHPLASARLARETGERAVVRDALFRALGNRPGLRLERRGRSYLLLPDPAAIGAAIFNKDRAKPVDRVAGLVPKASINWTEACGLRLDYRLDILWLLLEPRVVVDVPDHTPPDQLDLAREFVRERRARRHNRLANALLDGWIRLIAGDAATLRLRAFGISDGIDAEFELTRISGFSGAA